MTAVVTHPDYSACIFPSGGGDRCACGGVRHWHASPPYGCDDCPCTEFTLAPEPPDQDISALIASRRAVQTALADAYERIVGGCCSGTDSDMCDRCRLYLAVEAALDVTS